MDTYQNLDRIYNGFHRGDRLVSVTCQMKLTKTRKAVCEAILLNDIDLRNDVLAWIASRSSARTILDRYQSPELPSHFPARVVSGLGSISSGQNIFLFFPECLGVQGRTPKDFFGIELIDVWANIFQKSVFPCARNTFTAASQIEMMSVAGPNLDKSIYLASIFHEVGHQVGAWRVSPSHDPRLKISQFYLDVFGEMSTDSQLVLNLPEFPEIAMFVLLQRIFWFGRRGFRDDPMSAMINTDNDSWLSALLWNRMQKAGAFVQQGHRWQLHFGKAREVFKQLHDDVEQLGTEVLKCSTQFEQDQMALQWMKGEVEWQEGHGFILPEDLRAVYRSCIHIEEIPYFHPLAEYTLQGEVHA